MPTLERIEARKKEAVEKNLSEKAKMVALYLYNRKPEYRSYQGDGYTDYSYVGSNGILVNYTSGGRSSSQVQFNKVTVFLFRYNSCDYGYGVQSYVPGAWEKILDELYVDALSSPRWIEKQKKDGEFQREREVSERAKWGL